MSSDSKWRYIMSKLLSVLCSTFLVSCGAKSTNTGDDNISAEDYRRAQSKMTLASQITFF